MSLSAVSANRAEVTEARAGDEIVAAADVVMDPAFTVPAPLEAVWPWVIQLGKRRAGWHFPRTVELVKSNQPRAEPVGNGGRQSTFRGCRLPQHHRGPR